MEYQRTRRHLLKQSLALAVCGFSGSGRLAAQPHFNLLDPERLARIETPEGTRIDDLRTTYVSFGPINGPAILYFHGYGDGYFGSYPREYLLGDPRREFRGYRVLMPHRPGYTGTDLARRTTANDAADVGRRLIDRLNIPKVAVIGTSGGGPAALAFADRHSTRTAALILQCAVTHRWNDLNFVPYIFRSSYREYAARRLSKDGFITAMGAKMQELRRGTGLIDAIVGKCGHQEIKNDPAYSAFLGIFGKYALDRVAGVGHISLQ